MEAITCYACNSNKDSNCGEQFVEWKLLSDRFKVSGCAACGKYVEKKPGKFGLSACKPGRLYLHLFSLSLSLSDSLSSSVLYNMPNSCLSIYFFTFLSLSVSISLPSLFLCMFVACFRIGFSILLLSSLNLGKLIRCAAILIQIQINSILILFPPVFRSNEQRWKILNGGYSLQISFFKIHYQSKKPVIRLFLTSGLINFVVSC